MGSQIVKYAEFARRNPTHKTRYHVLDKTPEHMRLIIGRGFSPDREKIRAGLGAALDEKQGVGRAGGLGAIIDLINNSKDNPVWNMDVIEQVRWGMLGPQTPESITANFGSTIDLFGSGKSVAGIDFVETTMAQTGQTQTYFVACYLGFHVETDPMQWDTIGNAWTHPVSQASSVPASPDAWTLNDLVNPLGLGFATEGQTFSGQAFVPAVMRHGWWANLAAWHLVRGYNIRWRIGQHTNIMDEVLRHTAYMPPNAQEGSASSSEVDIVNFVLEMNKRYDQLGSGLNFLPVDCLRVGSVGAGGANVGSFAVTSDFKRVGATFGGMDLRSMLRGNSEFRKLTLPYVIKPGVPIGIFLQENDTDQGDQMRANMDITEGQRGAIPPIFGPDPNIVGSSGGFTVGINERTIDGSNVSQQFPLLNAVFKDGNFKLSLMIKGFEVTEDWYNIMSANADIREVVMNACGLRFAMQGSG